MDWHSLVSGEKVLTNGDVHLYRQVHPSWFVDGMITSQAFKPTTKDRGKVSVRMSTVVTAEEAYQYHISQGLKSIGTYQVTVDDIVSCELHAIDDSRLDSAPRGHAYIDYRGIAKKPAERAAKELRTCAMRYGAQYDPS